MTPAEAFVRTIISHRSPVKPVRKRMATGTIDVPIDSALTVGASAHGEQHANAWYAAVLAFGIRPAYHLYDSVYRAHPLTHLSEAFRLGVSPIDTWDALDNVKRDRNDMLNIGTELIRSGIDSVLGERVISHYRKRPDYCAPSDFWHGTGVLNPESFAPREPLEPAKEVPGTASQFPVGFEALGWMSDESVDKAAAYISTQAQLMNFYRMSRRVGRWKDLIHSTARRVFLKYEDTTRIKYKEQATALRLCSPRAAEVLMAALKGSREVLAVACPTVSEAMMVRALRRMARSSEVRNEIMECFGRPIEIRELQKIKHEEGLVELLWNLPEYAISKIMTTSRTEMSAILLTHLGKGRDTKLQECIAPHPLRPPNRSETTDAGLSEFWDSVIKVWAQDYKQSLLTRFQMLDEMHDDPNLVFLTVLPSFSGENTTLCDVFLESAGVLDVAKRYREQQGWSLLHKTSKKK